MNTKEFQQLEENLSHPEKATRDKALDTLVNLDVSEIPDEAYPKDPNGTVNLHMHTFFSYNPYGWSPARCLWELVKTGAEYGGIVEFDVLDGLEESSEGGRALNIPTVVGIETRVFVPELASVEINSPGEPGVAYMMGTGFHRMPQPGSPSENVLNDLRQKARTRNLVVMNRVNDFLGDVAALEYDKDVMPMTPKGNATERHMVVAYAQKVHNYFPGEGRKIAKYWAGKLLMEADEIEAVMDEIPKFHNLLRSKLMKKGGVGYVEPSGGSFPNLRSFFRMIEECGAQPVATWLDGTSQGEADPHKFLEICQGYGANILNIIPHRNYDLTKTGAQDTLYHNMQAVIEEAKKRGMKICMGTELNKIGQPIVDDFFNDRLAPYRKQAMEDAKFIYNHMRMVSGKK